jgi:hypothetical protein
VSPFHAVDAGKPKAQLGVIAVALLAAAPAHADKPTVKEVQAAVLKFRDAVPFLEDAVPDVKAATTVLAVPFWFDGIVYEFDVGRGKTLKKRCNTKKTGTLTTADALASFAECAQNAEWAYSIDGPDGEFYGVDPKALPSVFRKHKSHLQLLAKDHALVFSHFCPSAPGDYWTLYAATKDTVGNAARRQAARPHARAQRQAAGAHLYDQALDGCAARSSRPRNQRLHGRSASCSRTEQSTPASAAGGSSITWPWIESWQGGLLEAGCVPTAARS